MSNLPIPPPPPPPLWVFIFSLFIPPSFLVNNRVSGLRDSSPLVCLVGCFIFFSLPVSLTKYKSIILTSVCVSLPLSSCGSPPSPTVKPRSVRLSPLYLCFHIHSGLLQTGDWSDFDFVAFPLKGFMKPRAMLCCKLYSKRPRCKNRYQETAEPSWDFTTSSECAFTNVLRVGSDVAMCYLFTITALKNTFVI